MTELISHYDSYVKEFDSTIVEATNKGVVLGQTAFYPGGGGQPSDTGILLAGSREIKVNKMSRSSGELVHELDSESPAVGDAVHGVIDWERRYKLMRTHTALHILCGVIWRDYEAQVTGGDMKPLSARMDFELESMSADFAGEVEKRINDEVKAARPVHIRSLPREKAFKIPDLIRTKINLLPDSIKDVRTVDIEGLDVQADGGTHVANTSEVGTIKVVGRESKGRINKRLRIEIE